VKPSPEVLLSVNSRISLNPDLKSGDRHNQVQPSLGKCQGDFGGKPQLFLIIFFFGQGKSVCAPVGQPACGFLSQLYRQHVRSDLLYTAGYQGDTVGELLTFLLGTVFWEKDFYRGQVMGVGEGYLVWFWRSGGMERLI
jgi:hypothetical protein